MLRALNEKPVSMCPVLGSLGLETLTKWHSQGFHPVSLYAPKILSNPKDADDFRCGPFPMWLHDIGHSFWGSMLTKAQRDAIFATYVPALHHLKEIAEAYLDDRTIEFLKEAEIKACDFDLTATTYYAELETRYDHYLAHTIGKNPSTRCVYTMDSMNMKRSAPSQRQSALFSTSSCYVCHSKTPQPFKEVYRSLISFITTGKGFREQRSINALQRLAKQAAIDSDVLFTQGPSLGNWNNMTWQRLLNSDRVSAELWFSLQVMLILPSNFCR